MNGTLVQFLAALALSLGQLFTSFSIAWPSYTLELFESDHSPIGNKITKMEGSLLGSLPMAGSIVGTIIIGFVGDILGRKKAMIMSELVFVLSWSLITTANNVTLLLIARTLLGLAVGFHIVTVVSYVSELGTDTTRGPLMSMMIFFYTSGTLVSYICGWLLSYQVINYLMLTLCVLSVVFTSFLKETPTFLIFKGKEQEAIQALKFYRGSKVVTPAILDEFKYLLKQNGPKIINNPNSEDIKLKTVLEVAEDLQEGNGLSAWKTLCTSKAVQRTIMINCMSVTVMVIGGTIAVTSYAGPLFAIAAPNLSKHMCSIILSFAFTVGSLLAPVGNGLLKRRTQMMASSSLSAVFLFILASLLRWSWGPEWLIPLVILAYCFCFQLGVGNIPAVQMAEIILPKVKNLASTLALCFMNLWNFIVLATFAFAVKSFGLDGTFFMFGLFCVIITVYSYYIMPETKGRPIEETMRFYETNFLYTKRK